MGRVRGPAKRFALLSLSFLLLLQTGAFSTGGGWAYAAGVAPRAGTTISAGIYHSLAVKADGSLWAWGLNTFGSLGVSTSESGLQSTPVKVMDGVVSADAGGYHSLAVKADGSLWAWGDNLHGQLGDGTRKDRYSPVKIMNGVVSVTTESSHSFVFKADSSLWAWGDNPHGQLGDGTRINRYSPVKIMDGVAYIATGGDHSLAVKTDGSLWAWGYNYNGQLGDGTTEDRYNRPVKIMDGVASIAAEGDHSFAIKTDGSLWAWGKNLNGKLGDGTTEDRHKPVKIMDGVVYVSTGRYHSLAIKTDGSLWAWGANYHGQLGDGTTENRYRPVKILDDMSPFAQTPAIPFLSSYPYPEATLTEAQVRAIAEALAGILDGELTAFYRLADDLYYAVVTVDGRPVGGAVVREGKGGVFRVLASGELLDEAEIAPYIAEDAARPNVTIRYGEVAGFTEANEYAEHLRAILRDTDGTKPNNAAMGEIAAYIENAAGALSAVPIEAKGNRVTLRAADIEPAAARAREAEESLSAVLGETGVSLGRPVTLILRVLVRGLDAGEPVQIKLDEAAAAALGDASLLLLLGDDGHAVTLSAANLRAILNGLGAFVMQFTKTGENAYNIVFLDADGKAADKLPAPVEISLPANGADDTILAGFRGGSENWGGQYDAANGTIRFSTPYSGSYEVLENKLDIADIADLPEEQKTAIGFMAGKGFLDLENGSFVPDGTLNRYAFAKALTRMFFALDRDLETSFTDVPADSEFYPYIASAEHADIVEGVGNDLYAGDRLITREQAVAIAARTLVNKKGYSMPTDAESLLASFGDRDEISGWAREILALGVREGLVLPGESLRPKDEITRAEAALLLYRLFMLLHETSPVAIEMSAFDEDPADTAADARDPATAGDESATVPVLPIVAATTVLVLLAGAAALLYARQGKARRAAQAAAQSVASDPVPNPGPPEA